MMYYYYMDKTFKQHIVTQIINRQKIKSAVPDGKVIELGIPAIRDTL